MNRTIHTHHTGPAPRRRRLVAVTAAALVLGGAGSATAATLVTGAQIKDGTVHGRDITDRSLTGRDVRDMSLTPADFAELPRGPQGPEGPPGPRGAAGASGLQYVTVPAAIGAGQTITWSVPCPDGKKVAGGGVSTSAPGAARVVESAPLDDGAGWWIALTSVSTNAVSAYGWAVCVTG